MAPDLNSVPPSPRPLASSPQPLPGTGNSRNPSRRTSAQAAPPILPLSPSLNILPSNQSAVNQAASPPLASPSFLPANMATVTTGGDNSGVGTGPGPLRHPRPLTAADLHLQLEKEQEAVVNRLTRELSMLRAAQNASVVSNASSTSTGLPDQNDTNHLVSGPSHPIPAQRRHHRSSSSTSTRSISGTSASLSTVGGVAGSTAPSTTADRHSRGILPRHDSIPQSTSMSRQNSMTSSRRSGASSPVPFSSAQSSYQHPDHFPHYYPQRPGISQHLSASHANLPTAGNANPDSTSRRESMTQVTTTGRYEETAYHRNELEAVKRENEALKRKIRELERTLRTRRQSDASVSASGRGRSESVSTTASGVGRGRDKDDDAVGVGESASTGRLR
ncbi:hypothetical protein BP5796_07750 [Coleophoma crateriformis]|uniref:Uncharacterized protein n=1 Tax=Coleophoma crateriformis TaxID=565419 RepID=A0A3D8RCN9_9HELO|nr:hypothetical protein BP5796_07750 [Coleophoma crateriformis]